MENMDEGLVRTVGPEGRNENPLCCCHIIVPLRAFCEEAFCNANGSPFSKGFVFIISQILFGGMRKHVGVFKSRQTR